MLFGKGDLFVSKFAFLTKSAAFVCGEVETNFFALRSLWFMLLKLFVFGPGKPSSLLIFPNSFLCGRCSRVEWSPGGYTTGT